MSTQETNTHIIWPFAAVCEVIIPTYEESGSIGVLAAIWMITRHNFSILTGNPPKLEHGLKHGTPDRLVIGMNKFFK